jgi:hypothetical protein
MLKPLLVIGLPALVIGGTYFGLSRSRVPKLDRQVEQLLRVVPFLIAGLIIVSVIGTHLVGSENVLAAFQRFLFWLHE